MNAMKEREEWNIVELTVLIAFLVPSVVLHLPQNSMYPIGHSVRFLYRPIDCVNDIVFRVGVKIFIYSADVLSSSPQAPST